MERQGSLTRGSHSSSVRGPRGNCIRARLKLDSLYIEEGSPTGMATSETPLHVSPAQLHGVGAGWATR
ncbi:hypothetical protein GT037_002817 [Alternaria burnsii]|uniref:Uncharacterized protein n=1 Tax=Alternaria burnsii TaxID=1187904 RepID=A0A8H7BCI9_9PLEO|nr:uncharacterized protein GT037_002817 [Alternaria burnsii]KAF7679069.1 hypothetical protein GT037_002817 [Alternaria burnsii]